MTECHCTMRTKLVGDGCEVCNPTLAREMATDQLRDAERMLDLYAATNESQAQRLMAVVEERDKLREAARMALGALKRWDGLIEHQYTGTRPAMDAMHRAAQATVPVLEALREALGEDK